MSDEEYLKPEMADKNDGRIGKPICEEDEETQIKRVRMIMTPLLIFYVVVNILGLIIVTGGFIALGPSLFSVGTSIFVFLVVFINMSIFCGFAYLSTKKEYKRIGGIRIFKDGVEVPSIKHKFPEYWLWYAFTEVIEENHPLVGPYYRFKNKAGSDRDVLIPMSMPGLMDSIETIRDLIENAEPPEEYDVDEFIDHVEEE